MKRNNRNSLLNSQKLKQKQKVDEHQINSKQFQTKLDTLLNKISIQSKYVNRVSSCNVKNMQELTKVTEQLNNMKQIRKLQQINQIHLKNINNELSSKLNQAQSELNYVVNQLFQVKKQVKRLKKILQQQQIKNTQLQAQIARTKRQCYLTNIKQIQNGCNISYLINHYLMNNKSQSLLYKHCLQYFNSLSYDTFFTQLQSKIIKQINNDLRKQRLSNFNLSKQRVHTEQLNREISERKIQHIINPSKLQNYSTLNFPSVRMKTQSYEVDMSKLKQKRRKKTNSQLQSFLLNMQKIK